MTIGEVIAKLVEIKRELGDLRADVYDDYDYFPVEEIEFDPDS